MRDKRPRVHAKLQPWSALGAQLGAWEPGNVVCLGSVLGVGPALSIVSGARWLNSRLYESLVCECRLARRVLDPTSASELLSGLGEGDAPTPPQAETHLLSFSLALRFRVVKVRATPRVLARWVETVGLERAFVRPAGEAQAERWCAALYRSLLALGDRLWHERSSLDPRRADEFREWVRYAAPLGPERLGLLVELKPWRADPGARLWSSDRVGPATVERATRWLANLEKWIRPALPTAADGASP
jgi:hypothetical protein